MILSIFCLLFFIILTAIVIPLGSCIDSGQIIYVDDDNTEGPWNGSLGYPYQYIQDGVDAADTNDTVYVFNGTYHENIKISGKSMELNGENRNITIIDGDNLTGIEILVDFVNISEFTITNATDWDDWSSGVEVHSSNNRISNNIITNNLNAITLGVSCENITIDNNSIFNNDIGIESIGKNHIIQDNIIYNTSKGLGIFIRNSINNSILRNTFYNDGIRFNGPTLSSFIHIFKNNTVNEKPLYYYKNQNGVNVPSNAGQILIVNCSNVTITGMNITETDAALEVAYSSEINISYNNISNSYAGILLWCSSNAIIQYNNLSFADGDANIFLHGSDYNTIRQNNISFFHLWESGIIVSQSDYNVIKNNTITSNNKWGIWSLSALNNEFYHNNFLENLPYNAKDQGGYNQWDNDYPSGGNFWDDYDGEDSDEDGIGDTPYSIPPNEDTKDWYPLMNTTRNVPPLKPDEPSGIIFCLSGVSYTYKTSADDFNEDQIYYKWNWGDGNLSDWLGPFDSGEIVSANHSWNKSGCYNIRVKAKDTHGYESYWSDPIPIYLPYYVNRVVSKQHVVLGQSTIKFNCTVKGGNNPYSFEWNFGDGNFSNIQNTTYTYNTTGIYGVTLKVNDSNGSIHNSTINISVVNLKADFNMSISGKTKTNETIYFNDNCESYCEIVNWSWDFGDGNTSYNQNTSHVYPSEGVYRVKLTVTDNVSNSEVIDQIIYIDSKSPIINESSASPNTVGFGCNVGLLTNVVEDISGLDVVKVNISYPDGSCKNYSMSPHPVSWLNIYFFSFNETWKTGQYNFTIWATDKAGNTNNSSGHSFNVSTNATISVCTIKDEYGNDEVINLTDPPGVSPLIGYELLDDDNVLHIWNKYGSYYFDTSSGIQLTNHYNEYWSHNVLMLGYYNNDQWNLMYRTDELSGFNKDIDTDNETYVNVTMWKNLEYMGYDFRLAIRYYLGVDDNELTIIPYIKNIDQSDIPYVLGFGWEMKDIQIDMTTSGDYIDVNGSMYYLNQTLNNTYTDLSESEFYLTENITETHFKSLYLKWNNSLNYKLQVKSREGQYNAPVTLFIRIGTLVSGQEKYTKMYWYDADQKTYYFNSYDNSEAWATNPSFMVDGSTSNYASTTSDGDIELCDGNNCSGSDIGEISAVEIRLCAYVSNGPRNILLRPVFGGTTDGLNNRYTPTNSLGVWSPWFEITRDPYAPTTWTWTDIDNLDSDVEVENNPMGPPFSMYCCQVEVRVTYDPYNHPEISNPVPADGSTGVSLTPTLNITVSDADGELMNITWLSNSSGSWQVFGTNNSINNGTYHQTFTNATENAKFNFWKVNVTDGKNYTESNVYKFYTGYQSKINNTGSYHFTGYLLIQVQYYNSTSENWEVADDTVNETTTRIIPWEDPGGTPEQNILALDTIFNGLVNTSNLSSYGNGTYRIYAAFRDPDGDVLVCDDDTELKATYEFTITFE
jgi:parallel beta-helix repeat protein